MSTFELQFAPGDISVLAGRYSYRDDSEPRAAGAAAAARGSYTREQFLEVCNWKAPRARRGFSANSADQVEDATRRAFETEYEDECMDALLELGGVGVPIASTLLHFAFPKDYPILDVRALEALGCRARTVYSVSFWLDYLYSCRDLAEIQIVDLRTLDKALWQWSKERSIDDPPGPR